MIPRKLNPLDIKRLQSHLTSLRGEDRRLRFGGIVSDSYINEYVEKSLTGNNKWFGVENETKIPSARIGEMVMVALEKLDKVAFVRLASVYKNFERPEDFQKFIKQVVKQ